MHLAHLGPQCEAHGKAGYSKTPGSEAENACVKEWDTDMLECPFSYSYTNAFLSATSISIFHLEKISANFLGM